MKRVILGLFMAMSFASVDAGAGSADIDTLPSMRTAQAMNACRTQAEEAYPEVHEAQESAVSCKLTDSGLTCSDSSDRNHVVREHVMMECARAAIELTTP